MPFRLRGDQLQSDTSETAYQVSSKFRRVLATLSAETVPRALILLGILTEQVQPVGSDPDQQIQTVSENVDRAPVATIPPETVSAVMWLLHEVKPSLDSTRKWTIGALVSSANLDTPTVAPDGDTDDSTSEATDSPQSSTDSSSKQGRSDTLTAETAQSKQPSNNRTQTSQKANATVECEFCEEPFSTERELRFHSIQCSERSTGTKFQCNHCENEYVSRSALRTHLEDCDAKERDRRSTSAGPTYTCDTCAKSFDSHRQLLEHRRRSRCESQQRPKGTVERNAIGAVVHFDTDGGYGFIRSSDFIQLQEAPSDRADDLFFHISQYPGRSATKGEQLRFDIVRTTDGYRAKRITRVRKRTVERWDDTFASDRPRWGTK